MSQKIEFKLEFLDPALSKNILIFVVKALDFVLQCQHLSGIKPDISG